MKYAIRTAVMCVIGLTLATSAWAQWSSDPLQNLALSNIPGADQVQPKLLPLPNNSWYVSWFNNNPNDPPPNGYDVYYQMLSANGVEQFQHDGVQVAKLTLSSTEDYGLAIDSAGNALLAFLDDRNDPDNPQVTAAKMSSTGQALWGPNGIAMTLGPRLPRGAKNHRHQRRQHRCRVDNEQLSHPTEAGSQRPPIMDRPDRVRLWCHSAGIRLQLLAG